MATLKGLEPSTSAVTGRRSNQLSYSATSLAPASTSWQRAGFGPLNEWWARLGLNQRPPACEADALPLSYAPIRCRTGLFYATSAAPVYRLARSRA